MSAAPQLAPLRAAIVTRVSKTKGRSTRQQEEACRDQCAEEGWEVVAVLTDDGRSASRWRKRDPASWEPLKQLIADGVIDVVVSWEASRRERDLGVFLELRNLLEKHRVKLAYSGQVYDMTKRGDRKRATMDAVDSEDEAEATRDRILRNTRAQAAKGMPHGRRLYGYDRSYDSATGELVNNVIKPVEAAVVVEAAGRFAAGESAYRICVDFNRRGIRTGTGTQWRGDQIKRMLTNPAYIAKRVHQGQVVGDASWEAILDRDVFDICAARYADPARTMNRDRRDIRHLLTGIARCGKCGGRMYRGKNGARDLYQCKQYQHLVRDMRKLDAYVVDHVLEFLSRGPDDLFIVDEPAGDDHRARIAELRRQLDDAYAAWKAKELSATMLGRAEAYITAEIAAVERDARRAAPVPAVVFDIAGPDVAARWDADDFTIEDKRTVIKALFDITVWPTRTGRRMFDPDAVTIERRVGPSRPG